VSGTPPPAKPNDATGQPGRRRPATPWPWVVMAVVLVAMACGLRAQGRLWWCACGRPVPWSGDARGPHNSQHLADPYTLTHVLHGLAFYGLLAWACPRVPVPWRLCVAVGLEALWELAENSAFVIARYRATTAALGYEGDTVANSVGDLVSTALGFAVARRLGWRGSAALFLVVEGVLLLTIRDSLVLSAVTLVYPVPGLAEWQAGP
jgi:hypothetical protein